MRCGVMRCVFHPNVHGKAEHITRETSFSGAMWTGNFHFTIQLNTWMTSDHTGLMPSDDHTHKDQSNMDVTKGETMQHITTVYRVGGVELKQGLSSEQMNLRSYETG